ncbi:hypothetical protein GS399_11125 [Pedobacter sp. HMF7647]|uniref:Uncharacterized protein n=1 Tax=Hufsiella arboris TaxID=2695275 RepID=A0A7K1YAC6_9SPHI|nr:hypothetical protein [Hufsiella arboris]MXV51523.1 hypothetical protein [Hufsiella arboris]
MDIYIGGGDQSSAGVGFGDLQGRRGAYSQFNFSSINEGDYLIDGSHTGFSLWDEPTGIESQVRYSVGRDTPGAKMTVHIQKSTSEIVEGSFSGKVFKFTDFGYRTDKKLYDIEGAFRVKRRDKI